MARIALDTQNSAPAAALGMIASAPILSSYSEALDTVGPHATSSFSLHRADDQVILLGSTGPNIPWFSRFPAQDEGFPDALNLLTAACPIPSCSLISLASPVIPASAS